MMKKTLYIVPLACAMAATGNYVFAKDVNIDVTLKNLYANRDPDEQTKPITGSWSQSVIARGNTQYALSDDTKLLFTGSVQYARRLSEDKHLNDMILPFDVNTQKQASSYNKVAGSMGVQHKNHKVTWGEQWVDTPLATTDYSRQLITIYQGLLYSGQLNKQLNVDIGYLDKYSPRNEEDFRKISVNKKESDGLAYIDLKHKAFDNKLQTQIFVSELEDLYNQYSI